MQKFLVVLLCATLSSWLLDSCRHTATLFQATENISNAVWLYQDTVQFEFSITDTSRVVDFLLTVEHVPDFDYQNLYVRAHTVFPSGKTDTQVFSLELADNGGNWYGECDQETCQLTIPLQKRIYFPETGDYHFNLEQHMRQDSMRGIKAFTLLIKESEELDTSK